VVTTGAMVTLRVATVVRAVPAELVKTALYWSPFSPALAVNEYVDTLAPTMGVKVVPELEETSHLTVGAGFPEALALKVAFPPDATVTLDGSLVTLGDPALAAAARAGVGTGRSRGPMLRLVYTRPGVWDVAAACAGALDERAPPTRLRHPPKTTAAAAKRMTLDMDILRSEPDGTAAECRRDILPSPSTPRG
jgi:hypothetical protein